MRRIYFIFLLSFYAIFICPVEAQIIYSFTVDNISASDTAFNHASAGAQPEDISTITSITGTFTLDPAVTDTDIGNGLGIFPGGMTDIQWIADTGFTWNTNTSIDNFVSYRFLNPDEFDTVIHRNDGGYDQSILLTPRFLDGTLPSYDGSGSPLGVPDYSNNLFNASEFIFVDNITTTGQIIGNMTVTNPVPEPSTYVLLILLAILGGLWQWRKQKKQMA